MENETPQSDNLSQAGKALRELVKHEPQRHPIVIGLVSPLGTPIDAVVDALSLAFSQVGYSSETIKLSDLMSDFPDHIVGEIGKAGEATYYTSRMDAGDRLRLVTQNSSVLAAMAIARVAEHRHTADADTKPFVYILRTLKHPDEHALLRQVYGEAFSLLAVSAGHEERLRNLAELLAPFGDADVKALQLIQRDDKDPSGNEYGQHVGDLFHLADAYIPVERGHDAATEIIRFVQSLFGHPFITPRPDEEGMKIAWDASLRSASMGQQVGAALIPTLGTPVVIGTNEVPKPGGGQYWTDDEPDFRDFQGGYDPNPAFIQHLLAEFFQRMNQGGMLNADLAGASPAELVRISKERGTLDGARIKSLIEFTRCVHAEQSAILNAARSGVSTQAARMFTTTFPCHECTKLIIGAGIAEVIYIVPYPKSLANRLFGDLIDTQPPMSGAPSTPLRISFRPFQGIAPRRYEQAFKAGERRVGTRPASLEASPFPRLGAWIEEGVAANEDLVIAALKNIVDALPAPAPSPAQAGPAPALHGLSAAKSTAAG